MVNKLFLIAIFLPMLSHIHIIFSQVRDAFVAKGGDSGWNTKYMLPSPFDKPFLTNVFDDVEAVGDGLRAIFFAQQPGKKGNVCLGGRLYKFLCLIELTLKNYDFSLLPFHQTQAGKLLFAVFDGNIKGPAPFSQLLSKHTMCTS